ncbi:hypothetical protein X777_14360 [Ooceraea biroi]|uniref:C2H2-type domain-containing protein n=1 Tax=Ooceraea biroi TaxID=2015173 RepID=A0A026WUZ7_OOCBI|nr:hypothetical protein X777_14360 [Ooceraea biroi]
MEAHESEQYVAFPLAGVHDAIQESVISHEEICEPVDECVLQEDLTEVSVGNAVVNDVVESQGTVAEPSDEEDDNQTVYPMYIKQEEQQQYTSGDDESMAVEALRQLGGMYPFENKKLCCPTCKRLFTQEELSEHQSACTAKLSCTTCGEKFERKLDLNNHMVCHQVDRPHACRTCGNLFRSKSSLQAHMTQVHQVERPHKCAICSLEFQRPSSLSNHMKIHTNSKWGKHACTECGKKFATKQKMFRHQWIHRKKTHSCEVCGSQFEKQNELDEHRLSAHPGDSPFTCPDCGKSFVSRQGLWEHGRTHGGSPAHFQCDTCSKTFSSRQGYLIHNRTHTGERPYGCRFCWKAFRDGGTLRKHERIHTGERPHVCPLCTRAFNQKVVLREHVRWVHAAGKNETEANRPPYPCPLCGALNQDRDELCAHIVKHSDQMIAEAKAKTNNHTSPKSKTPKKKSSKVSVPCDPRIKPSTLQHLISKAEEDEALLSIADTSDKAEDMHVDMDDRQNNAFVVVTTTEKRNEGFIAISELKHGNIRFIVEGKEDENVHVIQVDQNHADPLSISDDATARIVATESVDDTVLDGAIGRSDMTTMHLIQSPKQNNTLNIISRQNESLPVLTIPNPQSHEDYSSQIVQVSGADISMDVITEGALKVEHEDHVQDEQDVLMQEEASHVIQVVHYHRRENDSDDFVCGICDEMFKDKNTLKEHIKVHI